MHESVADCQDVVDHLSGRRCGSTCLDSRQERCLGAAGVRVRTRMHYRQRPGRVYPAAYRGDRLYANRQVEHVANATAAAATSSSPALAASPAEPTSAALSCSAIAAAIDCVMAEETDKLRQAFV